MTREYIRKKFIQENPDLENFIMNYNFKTERYIKFLEDKIIEMYKDEETLDVFK